MADMLTDLLADIFDTDPEEIIDETDLAEDLGADEQDLQEIFFNLEEMYRISAPLKDIYTVRTVQDLRKYIKRKGTK